MIRDLTTNWKDEIAKADMLGMGDAKLVNQIFPVRSGQEFAPGRMHGPYRARTLRRASRFSRTILISNTTSPPPGT